MAKGKDKVVTLRVLLIKADFKKDDKILKGYVELQHFELAKGLPFEGQLYIKPQFSHPPAWTSFVKPHVIGDLAKLKNASTAAVLIIEAEGRKLAFTFGYGRNLLNPESWERDFGLKVALNTVDHNSLRSVDCRTFEELTLQTRRQTSRASGLDAFGLNVHQDLVRQVMGTPKSKDFARRIAGSDGLMIAVPLAFSDLGKKSKELLAAYASTDYKKRFGFIDYLYCERNPAQIAQLNQKLLTAIQTGKTDSMHLAPPEPIDPEEVDGYTYESTSDATQFPDLEVSDLMQSFADIKTLTVDQLRRARVGVKFANATQPDMKWSAFHCIVYEVDDQGSHYVLTCGEWYAVQKSYAAKIAARVKQIATAATLTLPPSKANQNEGDYNEEVAKSSKYVLLDKQCTRALGDPIEPCDLFTPARQFVHVKRKTRSATLSHLFSQGVISADCFVSDEEFRKDLKKIISAANPALGKNMPDNSPKNDEYEIVYAIISKPTNNWPASLPFFSQLNLMNAADHLERMRFRVSLVHVKEQ